MCTFGQLHWVEHLIIHNGSVYLCICYRHKYLHIYDIVEDENEYEHRDEKEYEDEYDKDEHEK
jgi:hypothetical protein